MNDLFGSRLWNSIMKKKLYFLGLLIVVCVGLKCFASFSDPDPEDKSLYGPYKIVRVVDGDTIIVNINDEDIIVRLIGINAPESVHPDTNRNTIEGVEASEWMKELLPAGTNVYLEYDVEIQDKYGRTLAYVYLDDMKTMVNMLLLKSGYAEIMTVYPNVRYVEKFSNVKG